MVSVLRVNVIWSHIWRLQKLSGLIRCRSLVDLRDFHSSWMLTVILLLHPQFQMIFRYKLCLSSKFDLLREIPTFFQGFTAVIDSRNQYPLTTRKSYLIRPGHMVNNVKNLDENWEWAHKLLQNLISLSGKKVTSSQNIKSIDPLKRNCYFGHEHALKAHNHYSLVRIILSNLLYEPVSQFMKTECMHVGV